MAGTSNDASLPEGPPLAALQSTLLAAVLGARGLPGGHQIRVPDEGFFASQEEHFVLDENLAGPLSVAGLTKPLRVLSRAALADAAATQGQLAYWQFRPIAQSGGEVRVGLDGHIMKSDIGASALGLSGVGVTFVEQGGQWIVSGSPTYVAA